MNKIIFTIINNSDKDFVNNKILIIPAIAIARKILFYKSDKNWRVVHGIN